MTQPLNFTPKAIEDLARMSSNSPPGVCEGFAYLISKLHAAQVFVLADHGQLLDRTKPRPELPGLLFKPPFPVVALEYSAQSLEWDEGPYCEAKCSRRIALAWEWADDLPPLLRLSGPTFPRGAGVAVASIAYYDEMCSWVPISAAMHYAYDAPWTVPPVATPFHAAMIQSGRIKSSAVDRAALRGTILPLLPDVLFEMGAKLGSLAALTDTISADLTDEVNAYFDLCTALACKNVASAAHPAPEALNRQRLKTGKLPLKGFHVLEINGGGDMPGAGAIGDRSGPRSHLRRGHIRRLDASRVTWVNSTVVRGRGFVDKVYAA